MQYEPIKDIISRAVKYRFFRKLFFFCLDLLILRQWYVKQKIKKYLPDNKNILFYDAGSGLCQYSDFVLTKYPKAKIHAVDIKANYLQDYQLSLKTNEKDRFKFTIADLTEFIIPVDKADFVIVIDILEHIEDDIAVLKNIKKSMKECAYLLISTPSNFDNTSTFVAEHVRTGYSVDELTKKLNSCGFEVLETKYSYGFWGKIYWQLIMKNTLLMINFSKLMLLIIPFYLLVVFIPALICMTIDFFANNKTGNGIVLVCKS